MGRHYRVSYVLAVGPDIKLTFDQWTAQADAYRGKDLPPHCYPVQ